MAVDWSDAQRKAAKTAQMAVTLTKALGKSHARRWKFLTFDGKNRGDSRGIVDMIAIRRNNAIPKHPSLKSGDLLEVILIQCKGGNGRRPTESDRERLRLTAKFHGAVEVVLFEWKREKYTRYSVLRGDDWIEKHPAEIFG